MNRYIFMLMFLTASINKLTAQQIMPAPYDGGVKVNYVRTWNAIKPYTDDADVMNSSRTLQEVRQTTQYFDGLGRPLQTVVKKGSLVTGDTARDMVVPIVYDEFGRESYKYLSFAANNTGGNTSMSDGLFKLNPFQQDSTFNKAMFADETYYYGQTVFENSPLNRVLESYAPGNSWVGTAGEGSEAARRGVKMKYWINTVTDSVRIWNVTDVTNNFGTYASSSYYPAGELFKNVTQDEHNKQVIEFKDKEGKVVLKKVQLTADADTGTGKGYYGWLCTYYIYDDLNQLRAVVQPKGVELLAANSWDMSYSSNVILNEQSFRYEYDERGRMIAKKVPGAGIVYMIYDARDRMVMSQDSNMRADHKWLYTLYDGLNRPTTTGLITDDTYYNDAAYHRGQAATSTSYPNPGSYTNEQLTKTFYDDYDWRSGEGNPLSATRSNTYDGYLLTASNTTWPYPQTATTQSNQLRGMVTGTKTKVLGTSSDFLYSVNFYDDKARVIQTQATNITTGTDITTMQYSWTGQPLISIAKHEKAGTNAQTTITLTKTNYDDLSRPSSTEKKISTTKVNSGTMPGSWTKVNEHEYDALGQLKKKKLGATPIDSLEYEYNIRGWMLGMNRTYVKDTTSSTHWFGFDLGYDKTAMTVNGTGHSYAAAQYNGNINGMLWRSTGDDMLRKYDFTYDAANRFMSADFNQLNSNSFSKAAGIDFSVTGMSYDANGNIGTMNQKGWKIGGSVVIDSLLYGYNSNSNKLHHVKDRTNDVNSKLGDFKEITNDESQDYTYDGNGNMVADENKAIEDISYNHLNLPNEIAVTNKGTVYYTYDAAGNKLKKVVEDETTDPVVTLYLGGCVYENNKLQLIETEEGRARINADSSAVVYDYMVKDHLGNVRMVLTEEERTDMYPAATMETASATLEENLYSNLGSTREDLPSGFDDGITSPNEKGAFLPGNGFSQVYIGPAMALKVMAGDKFNVQVSSWWDSKDAPQTPINPLSSLLGNLNTSLGNLPGGHADYTELATSNVLQAGAENFLNSQSYDDTKPKAYLNWILFDERFNYVSSCSGFEQVGETMTITSHHFGDMPITKSGYLYIFTSNASPDLAVWFDNLQVTHTRGPLLEESHYYPFGLTMAGISSKALNGVEKNKEKTFQGQRFDDEFDLNWVQFKWRNHDPQIGRFIEIDPLSEKYVYNSTYAFSENKVTAHVELEGLESEYINDFFTRAYNEIVLPLARTLNQANPIAKLGEIVSARSIESDFTEYKPRLEATAELGMIFVAPELAMEKSVAFSLESSLIKTEIKSTTTTQLEKNMAQGQAGETIATQGLKAEFPDNAVLNQVSGKFSDGTRTVFDNVVLNEKTNSVLLINETKTGKGGFTPQQLRFWENGESVTFTGKNAGRLIGQNASAAKTPTRVTRIEDIGNAIGMAGMAQ